MRAVRHVVRRAVGREAAADPVRAQRAAQRCALACARCFAHVGAGTWCEPLYERRVRACSAASPYGQMAGWDLRAIIVKSGDELRQEQVCIQLIAEVRYYQYPVSTREYPVAFKHRWRRRHRSDQCRSAAEHRRTSAVAPQARGRALRVPSSECGRGSSTVEYWTQYPRAPCGTGPWARLVSGDRLQAAAAAAGQAACCRLWGLCCIRHPFMLLPPPFYVASATLLCCTLRVACSSSNGSSTRRSCRCGSSRTASCQSPRTPGARQSGNGPKWEWA